MDDIHEDHRVDTADATEAPADVAVLQVLVSLGRPVGGAIGASF